MAKEVVVEEIMAAVTEITAVKVGMEVAKAAGIMAVVRVVTEVDIDPKVVKVRQICYIPGAAIK